jgi:hypothetical protein
MMDINKLLEDYTLPKPCLKTQRQIAEAIVQAIEVLTPKGENKGGFIMEAISNATTGGVPGAQEALFTLMGEGKIRLASGGKLTLVE